MTEWPFAHLTPFCADLVVADPPWRFALHNEATGAKKAAQGQYECMDLDAIKALPVLQLAKPDCWLLLWVTAPMLPQGLETMRAWGFTYKTTVAWRKVTKNGKPSMGTGYIARSLHENVLIGSIGKPSFDKAFPSLFDGERREHSRKPERFYELVDRFAPEAWKVELFARQERSGWLSFGNESTKFNTEAEAA